MTAGTRLTINLNNPPSELTTSLESYVSKRDSIEFCKKYKAINEQVKNNIVLKTKFFLLNLATSKMSITTSVK